MDNSFPWPLSAQFYFLTVRWRIGTFGNRTEINKKTKQRSTKNKSKRWHLN